MPVPKGFSDVNLRLGANQEVISEGPHPRKAGGTQSLLRDNWLTLRARLADGTDVTESFIDLTRRRTHRNSRGKVKKKERSVCLIRLQLNCKADRYGDVAQARKRLKNPLKLPKNTELKALQATTRRLSLKCVVTGEPKVRDLPVVHETLLLGAYRVLNLARLQVAGPRRKTQ